MGVPLIASGKEIGVLQVGSLTQRQFTSEEPELLELAANRAASALASLMARDDRVAAEALQRSLLPSALPADVSADVAVRYVAGEGKVGGDWYDESACLPGSCG
jgi:sigma-B regulation protein RsbU (phosphoserine phosphatase)